MMRTKGVKSATAKSDWQPTLPVRTPPTHASLRTRHVHSARKQPHDRTHVARRLSGAKQAEWTLDTQYRSRHRQRLSHTLHATRRQRPATTRHITSECAGANDGPTTTQTACRETATLAGPATGRKTDGLKPPPALPPHSGTLPPRRRTMSKPGELMSFESSTWSSSSSSTS